MSMERIRKICKDQYVEKDYRYHIIPVVKNALLLAEKLNANKEVTEAGALLHDIGRTGERKNYNPENDHHIAGEQKTQEILKDLGFPQDFIDKVKHCVLTHRGRKGPAPETLEAEIVANADAMAHFDTFLDMFTFFMERNPLEDSVVLIEEKTERNWNKKLTLPEAREIARDKYNAALILIRSMKEYCKDS